MAEVARRTVRANEGTIRHSIAVADITADDKTWTRATIGGVDWTMKTCRRTEDFPGTVKLFVKLYCDTVEKHADAEVRAVVGSRLLGVDPINIAAVQEVDFTTGDATWEQLLAVWSSVIDPTGGFVVDGRITIEINVTVDWVKYLPPKIAVSDTKVLDLSDTEFADMYVKVLGEDGEGVHCHKAVMCRHSEAIHGAMTNSSMTEAKNGVFEIGDPYATTEGVEQFVRLNYDEWNKGTMDKHAIELFVLGEVLLCGRVKVLATLAIKRLLSVATFWPTLKAAVRIDAKYIVQLCGRFANDTPQRLADVINLEDGKEIVENEDKEGVMAVLLLLKAIGEMNAK